MLPKKNRLVKQKDIQNVLTTKYRFFFKSINILLRKNNIGEFRCLVVVSKKIHKRAIQRNLIRRRFQAIFEELRFKNLLPENLDVMIIMKYKDILKESILEVYSEPVLKRLQEFSKPKK